MRPNCWILLLIVMFGLGGCASIEGTRNKSYTYKKITSYDSLGKIAILSIGESSQYPMLSDMIESKLLNQQGILSNGITLIPSAEFSNSLHEMQKLDEFTSWYSTYETTKFFDKEKFSNAIKNINVDFIMSIRSINIDREKIRAVDAGYSGMVSDSNNVYRTNLKFIGELIDVNNKIIAWQGIGYSENINSPNRDLDLFIIIKHQRVPAIDQYLDEMVTVAVNGFSEEMLKSTLK